jgi:hypothetical protein
MTSKNHLRDDDGQEWGDLRDTMLLGICDVDHVDM